MWRNIPATLSHTQHHQLAAQNHYETVPLSKTLTEERSWLSQVIQYGTFECCSLPRSPLHPVYNWKLAGVKEQRVWRCAHYFSLQDSFVYDCCWPHAVKLQGNKRSYFHGYSVKGLRQIPSLTFLVMFRCSRRSIWAGPEHEMWSMSCWFTCFSQHSDIIKWIVPDLLALPEILSYIFSRNILKPRCAHTGLRPPLSSLIKHNDYALFIYGTSNSPVYIWTETH